MKLPPVPLAPTFAGLQVIGSQASFVLSVHPGSPYLDANATTYFLIEQLAPGSQTWTTYEIAPGPISNTYQTMVEVPVLSSGADYSFRVTAVNPMGFGNASAAATIHVKGVPAQPTIIGTSVSLGSSSSGVSFLVILFLITTLMK